MEYDFKIAKYYNPGFSKWVYLLGFLFFISFAIYFNVSNRKKEEKEKFLYYNTSLDFVVTKKLNLQNNHGIKGFQSINKEIYLPFYYNNLWDFCNIGDSLSKKPKVLTIKRFINGVFIDSFNSKTNYP